MRKLISLRLMELTDKCTNRQQYDKCPITPVNFWGEALTSINFCL